MRSIKIIPEYISTKYYGRQIPSKYWIECLLSIIFLILLCINNAYHLGKIVGIFINSESSIIQNMLWVLFFGLLLISIWAILSSSETKFKISDLSFITPLYLLIVLSTYYQYIALINNNKNITIDLFINGFYRNTISNNTNSIIPFILLMLIQISFYFIIIYRKKQIVEILSKEEALNKASKKANAFDSLNEYIFEDFISKNYKKTLDDLLKYTNSNKINHSDALLLKSTNYSEEVKIIKNSLSGFKRFQEYKATEEQLRIFSSIQHELGNKIPTLKHDLNDLKDYLNSKKINSESLLKEPIRPPLPGENLSDISTVENLIQRMDKKISYSISSIDSLGSIIKASPNSFKPGKENLFQYLSEEKEKNVVDTNILNILIEGDKNINLNIDVKQFSFLVQNFISNAYRHGGFEKIDKDYFILFRFYEEENNIVIDVINNGNPLNNNYTIEQFLEPYNYQGPSGNSGLGGYLIGIVLKNHNGKIEIVDKTIENKEYKVCFRITLPIK